MRASSVVPFHSAMVSNWSTLLRRIPTAWIPGGRTWGRAGNRMQDADLARPRNSRREGRPCYNIIPEELPPRCSSTTSTGRSSCGDIDTLGADQRLASWDLGIAPKLNDAVFNRLFVKHVSPRSNIVLTAVASRLLDVLVVVFRSVGHSCQSSHAKPKASSGSAQHANPKLLFTVHRSSSDLIRPELQRWGFSGIS